MRKRITLVLLLFGFLLPVHCAAGDLLRVGVAGLTHDHVHAVLRRHQQGGLEIIGIAEPNRDLAEKFSKRYGYSMDLVHDTLDKMLSTVKPQVISDYGSTFGHLKTVEAAASRGIHVMVEKPLAVSVEHARKMEALAKRHSIHLLTNYETTWYASHHAARRIVNAGSLGGIRKIVVHDGHQGPAEIGCSEEFLEWLTDPKLNGGGALMDFGCYGANLSTWLMKGERPTAVTAVTQQIKPDRYPHVEDEATIVLTYPKTQAILQASWNWNYNRKDIEVYCKEGYVHCHNESNMTVMESGTSQAKNVTPTRLKPGMADPYKYFAAIIHGDIEIKPTDLSALENNLIVVEILEAAKRSAEEGKTIRLGKSP